MDAQAVTNKLRTHPTSIIEDADHPHLWNVRNMAGYLVLSRPVDKKAALEIAHACNEAFDWGKEA